MKNKIKELLPNGLACFFSLFSLYELLKSNIELCLLAAGVSGLWLVVSELIDRFKSE